MSKYIQNPQTVTHHYPGDVVPCNRLLSEQISSNGKEASVLIAVSVKYKPCEGQLPAQGTLHPGASPSPICSAQEWAEPTPIPHLKKQDSALFSKTEVFG